MEGVLDRCLEPTNQMISNLIDIEQAYINTSHPDFLGPEQSFVNIFDDSLVLDSNNNIGVNNSNRNFNDGNNIKSFNVNSFQESAGKLFNKGINLEKDIRNGNKFYSKNKIDEYEIIRENIFLGYPNNMRPPIASSRDIMETCIVKNLISSYYHVLKKNINDLVPKSIMCFLVNESKMMAEKEMVIQLFKSNELESLLQEDPYLGKKRKLIKESLVYLKNSIDIITNFSEISLD
jgi:dynamin 1-like protein